MVLDAFKGLPESEIESRADEILQAVIGVCSRYDIRIVVARPDKVEIFGNVSGIECRKIERALAREAREGGAQ